MGKDPRFPRKTISGSPGVKVGYQRIRVSQEQTCLCTPAGFSHCLWEAQLIAEPVLLQ